MACGINDKSTAISTSWTNEYCDTTQRLENIEVIDLVLPFSGADTLKDALQSVPQVFMAIVKNDQVVQSSAVTATSFKEHPIAIATLSSLPNADTLTALGRTYLWALADRPDYPYNRYEALLAPARRVFLSKRDSMMASYKRFLPRYTLKIQSDLRGRGYQQRYLAMGKSVTPLSQHNFGFATDIVILFKGKPLKNIRFYRTFLDSIGSQYGLTWGGSFLGFIDPNHVQYYQNSAEMLRHSPALRLEFEAYLPYFKKRVQRMSAVGKAAKVEDTKALLQTLHQLHLHKACVCDTLAERQTPSIATTIRSSFQKMGYNVRQDILLIGDLNSQTTTLFHPSGFQQTLRLGQWTVK
ncbi:MAG: M15 family metallopeptidase [Spirosomataceae bacterium]